MKKLSIFKKNWLLHVIRQNAKYVSGNLDIFGEKHKFSWHKNMLVNFFLIVFFFYLSISSLPWYRGISLQNIIDVLKFCTDIIDFFI